MDGQSCYVTVNRIVYWPARLESVVDKTSSLSLLMAKKLLHEDPSVYATVYNFVPQLPRPYYSYVFTKVGIDCVSASPLEADVSMSAIVALERLAYAHVHSVPGL